MPAVVESTQKSAHGAWIEIRVDRLLSNLKALRTHAGPRTEVMAVVKANAYGHGLLGIARALGPEVRFLGVSSTAEARELRGHGIETPLFLFGCLPDEELRPVLQPGITLSVSGFDEAQRIAAASQPLERKTPVHVKVDTGMGRLGIPCREAFREIEKMAALGGISLDGIYTHFPAAEAEDGSSERQLYDFGLLLQALDAKAIRFRFVHASNSAASLRLKSPFLNLIRPGLMLYGLYPADSLRREIRLAPVLSLKSRIILLKTLRPGESVGYGRTFVAARLSTIAVLPVGYSHGYPFSASNRASVLYRGRRYPIAGRVSMDYVCVDLGDTAAAAGDEVTLLGGDGLDAIGAEELAQWADTIPYEIVTRLASRLPRVYL